MDYIIAIAVGAASVFHIDNDPALGRQYAGLVDADRMRRGISRPRYRAPLNIGKSYRVGGALLSGILAADKRKSRAR